jgi:beta-phosphoglucomutase-like phosphatase (HAD superfamily)
MLPQALILDLDGTLADTDHAWDVVLHDIPPDAVEGQRERWISMSSAEIARGLISAFPLRQSVEAVLRRKRRRFRQLVRKGLTPFPGLSEELARWMPAGVPLAVATPGSRREALLVLRKLGLLVRFEAVVTCDDVDSAKPAPGCYLLAAELLGKHPKDCSAIEDSINGMTAAGGSGEGFPLDRRGPGVAEKRMDHRLRQQ